MDKRKEDAHQDEISEVIQHENVGIVLDERFWGMQNVLEIQTMEMSSRCEPNAWFMKIAMGATVGGFIPFNALPTVFVPSSPHGRMKSALAQLQHKIYGVSSSVSAMK